MGVQRRNEYTTLKRMILAKLLWWTRVCAYQC